jgi:outer membrane cobalamin receptor
VEVPSADAEKYTLEYSFQLMPGSFLAQSQKSYSQQESSNWTKVLYERGRSTQEETEREAKHWINQTSTSNRYTALLEEENEEQHKAGPENLPKPPSIYIPDVKIISPLIQLSEQIAKQQYEIKALQDNQSNVKKYALLHQPWYLFLLEAESTPGQSKHPLISSGIEHATSGL